jgi:putative transposase
VGAPGLVLPPYMRRCPTVNPMLPVLYLRGPSTGDFKVALRDLLGADPAGLSPSEITRLRAA